MNLINHYRAEFRFILILVAVVALSIWASRFIPDDYFDSAITPILMSASTAVALCCAWITARHTEGYRVRKIWFFTLVLWGLLDGIYVISWVFMGKPVMNMGAYKLTTMELALGNLLGCLCCFFPRKRCGRAGLISGVPCFKSCLCMRCWRWIIFFPWICASWLHCIRLS